MSEQNEQVRRRRRQVEDSSVESRPSDTSKEQLPPAAPKQDMKMQTEKPLHTPKKNHGHAKKKRKNPSWMVALIIIEGLLIALLICAAILFAQNGWVADGASIAGLISTPTPIPTSTPTPEPTATPTPVIEYVYITPEPTASPSPTPIPTAIPTPVIEYVYITPEPTNPPTPTPNPTATPTPIIQYVYITPSPTPTPTPSPEHRAISDSFDIVQSIPAFFGMNWFEKTLSSIEKEIIGRGYVASEANGLGKALGVAVYQNSMKQPKNITVLFDVSSQHPNSISLSFSADTTLYNDIYNGINKLWGEGIFHAATKQTQGTYTIATGEHLTWDGNGYQYKLNGEGQNNQVSPSLDQIKNGKGAFVLTTALTGTESVLDKTKELTSILIPESTATPKPVQIKLDLAISSVRISKNSIGNPEVYVVFKNTSSVETIDRIDFAIRCFDAYGKEIKPYGFYDWTDNFYDDKAIRPGKSTSSDWHWTIFGCDGAKSVKIAITKYHTTSGKTVEVPSNSLKWHTFN